MNFALLTHCTHTHTQTLKHPGCYCLAQVLLTAALHFGVVVVPHRPERGMSTQVPKYGNHLTRKKCRRWVTAKRCHNKDSTHEQPEPMTEQKGAEPKPQAAKGGVETSKAGRGGGGWLKF